MPLQIDIVDTVVYIVYSLQSQSIESQPAIYSPCPGSTVYGLQSIVHCHSLQSIVCTMVYSLQSIYIVHSLQYAVTVYSLQSIAVVIVCSLQPVLQPMVYSLESIVYNLQSIVYNPWSQSIVCSLWSQCITWSGSVVYSLEFRLSGDSLQ